VFRASMTDRGTLIDMSRGPVSNSSPYWDIG
jgi:hypothetical protein